MKALLFLALFTPLAALSAFAGQETQNGGGAAEQNFAYALAILRPIYQMCLATDQCVANPEQHRILGLIESHMTQEMMADHLLRFDSGKTNHDLFFLDGQVRIAVTGLTIGAPIYVNRDMIYRHQGDAIVPYTVSEAVGVLTHELGHHQGIKDHDELDLLGGAVRAFFELQQDRLRLDTFTDAFDQADVVLNVFHVRQAAAPFAHHSLFWLTVDDHVFDLNPEIQKKLGCPMADSQPAELLGYRFSHLRWGDPVSPDGKKIMIPLEGQVWNECRVTYGNGPSDVVRQYKVVIFFPFAPSDRRLTYLEGALSISVEPMD